MSAIKDPQGSKSLFLHFLWRVQSPQRLTWTETYQQSIQKVWPTKEGKRFFFLGLLSLPFKLVELLFTLLADLADRAGQAGASSVDRKAKYGVGRCILMALLNLVAIPRLLVLPITSPNTSVFKGNVAESQLEARDQWMQSTVTEIIQRSYSRPTKGSREQFSIDVVHAFYKKIEAAQKKGETVSQEQQDLFAACGTFSLLTQIEQTQSRFDALVAQATEEFPSIGSPGAESNLASIVSGHAEAVQQYCQKLQALLEKIGVLESVEPSPTPESQALL